MARTARAAAEAALLLRGPAVAPPAALATLAPIDARTALAVAPAAAAAAADADQVLDGLARDLGVVGEAQADAPTLAVDLHHPHADLVAFGQHVLDAVHAPAGRDVGDVQQPVRALGELYEGAE